MKVLVTGSKGFIGKNLVTRLREEGIHELLEVDIETSSEDKLIYTEQADFIFHLAGINRPKNEEEFFTGNVGTTDEITQYLLSKEKKTSIVITSSIHAELDNAYGKSKKAAEDVIKSYRDVTGAGNIFRLPNVFGKWCRPNYNSAIATFCNNVARGEEIWVNDPKIEMSLVYIDDVVDSLIDLLEGRKDSKELYQKVDVEYKTTLGWIVETIKSFREMRTTQIIPDMSNLLTKKLYSTYLTYLEEDNFSYKLDKKVDNRGWLAELVKSNEFGQIFVSKTNPGITRGNHYHHTKVEKFIVINGKAEIKFRHITSDEVITYEVNGEDLTVLDIPPGYTHSIVNVGDDEVITLFWSNEKFNPNKPDTIFSEV